MIITDNIGYIQFTNITKPRTILKISVRDIVLDVNNNSVTIVTKGVSNRFTSQDIEIDYDKVTSPSTADVTALYNTLKGYLTTT